MTTAAQPHEYNQHQHHQQPDHLNHHHQLQQQEQQDPATQHQATFASQECARSQSQPLNLIVTKENGADKEDKEFPVALALAWHFNLEEDYKMSAKQRGICLIMNNVNFERDVLPQRNGSDLDAWRFKCIFKQLGFHVESKRNLLADKMKATFRQVSARCMAKHDALVVILLSHGTESGIYGTDGVEVDLNDILTYFDNRKCKQMMGKPKVFIVQACRGRKTDHGVKDSQAFFSQPESQTLTQASQQLSLDPSESPKISRWAEMDRNCHPTRTDMILCFSCHTGYVSTRNSTDGSWLCSSMAHFLQKEAWRKHLIEILNMVSRDVRSRKSADGYKQVLETTTIGFDKNLYFNPGLED